MAKHPRKETTTDVVTPRPSESDMESAMHARIVNGDMSAWDRFLARVNEWERVTGKDYASDN